MWTQAFGLWAPSPHLPQAERLPGAPQLMLAAGGPLLRVVHFAWIFQHVSVALFNIYGVWNIYTAQIGSPQTRGWREAVLSKQAQRQPPQKFSKFLNCLELFKWGLLSEAYPGSVSKMPRSDQWINKTQGAWVLEEPNSVVPHHERSIVATLWKVHARHAQRSRMLISHWLNKMQT